MNRQFFAMLLGILVIANSAFSQAQTIQLESNDVIAFLGGTNIVNVQKAGYLEAYITVSAPNAAPRFRDFAWEADTVYAQGTVIERWRKEKFGDLSQQLQDNRVTLAVVQFGQSEALDGLGRLDDFRSHYDELLSVLELNNRRVIVLSPIPFENNPPPLRMLAQHNKVLRQFASVAKALAAKRGCVYVDLLEPFRSTRERLTANGLHVKPSAQQRVAAEVANQLGVKLVDASTSANLRRRIAAKHKLWMDYWRPANWKCLYGDDGEREFGKATAGGLTLRQEWMQLPQMIQEAEAEIWQLAANIEAKEKND